MPPLWPSGGSDMVWFRNNPLDFGLIQTESVEATIPTHMQPAATLPNAHCSNHIQGLAVPSLRAYEQKGFLIF